MQFDLYPYGTPFHLILRVRLLQPDVITVSLTDPETKRVYSKRHLHITRQKTIRLKVPIACDWLRVSLKQHKDTSTIVEEIKVMPDTRCPLQLTDQDRSFIRFARWFSVEANRLQAGEKGTLYQYEGFTILFLDTIRENETELTTPARIAKASGIIEVSKKAIAVYTVPMLIVMLLHEYAHKYKNPHFGKAIENELTADLIALHIALNLGFDAAEVRNCFKAVFAQKDTELNRRRMGAITEFISLFEKQENQRCKTKKYAN